MSSRRRMPPVFVFAVLLLASCGGFKEKTTERAGADGSWRLERTRTSRIWAWLNRVGFIKSQLGDPGYVGERWWYVSPTGRRSFMRFLNLVAPDGRDGSPASFMPEAVERALGWGFSGLGYGADIAAWGAVSDKLPAIVNLSLDKWNGGLQQGVFDPWYGPSVAKACETAAGQVKDGMPVAGVLWEARPIASTRALYLVYAAMRADSQSKRRIVQGLRDAVRGDVKQLQARMPSIRSFDDLASRTAWDQYEGIDADADTFARAALAAYGGKVQQEVRNRFPKYLNLGPLLDPGLPPAIVQALASYVDVLTFAVWSGDGRLPRRYLEQVHEQTGKPILLLEAGQRLGTGPGPAVARTVDGMAESYRRSSAAAAALPFCVGFGWTAYRDSPTDAWGILDATSAPREPVARAARESNAALDARHRELAQLPESANLYSSDRFAVPKPAQAVGRAPAGFTVDGDLGEWPKDRHALKALRLEADVDPWTFAVARVAWTEAGLAVAVEVQDDAVEQSVPGAYWRDADFVEVLIDGSGRKGDGYSPAALHLALLPRGGAPDGRGALCIAVHHDGDGLKATQAGIPGVMVASNVAKAAQHGPAAAPRWLLPAQSWTLEALIPWATVQATAHPEARIGFNLIVRRQSGARADDMFWAATRTESGLDHPSTWGDLTLREQPE